MYEIESIFFNHPVYHDAPSHKRQISQLCLMVTRSFYIFSFSIQSCSSGSVVALDRVQGVSLVFLLQPECKQWVLHQLQSCARPVYKRTG